MSRNDKIYSATYSNVPVYEFNVAGNHVMRRRKDDYINATHILKAAEYDKPARTRILEREVQKNIHEKVQGGYGKYQGTWIPLHDGRELANKNGVLDKLAPIFDFVPGDRSPPPAPKHATASSKPRAPRTAPQPRRQPGKNGQERDQMNNSSNANAVFARQPDYEALDISMRDEDSLDQDVMSESIIDDFDGLPYDGGRASKRRKVESMVSSAVRDHQLWADELLDYFMLQDNPIDAYAAPPIPPGNADLNVPIDDKGHTALHWAAAMGDMEVVKDLLRRNAASEVQSNSGETPLMRAITFTNNYDRQNMEKLAGLFIQTVHMQALGGSTVFHQIARTTERKSKYQCARYYLDCIVNKMAESMPPASIEQILNQQDQNGDTAIMIAARNGARKLVRSLIGRNVEVATRNLAGETADDLIVQLNHRRQERSVHTRQLSSSPFQTDGHRHPHLTGSGAMNNSQPLTNGGASAGQLLSQSNHHGSTANAGSGFYRSEAALALESTTFPALLDKVRSLANSIEAELVEKQTEFAEAERVLDMRRGEIDALKRQQQKLQQSEEAYLASDPLVGEKISAELDQLFADIERMVEEEEAREMEARLAAETAGEYYPTDEELVAQYEAEERDEGADAEYYKKVLLLAEMHELAREHKALVKDLVQNLSAAGAGDKQQEYRRLLSGALRLREEDVEAMLPEIVAELEENRGHEAGA